MAEPEFPQIYLITPPVVSLQDFPATLARVLDAHHIACVRLALATQEATDVAKIADALRDTCHARDVALVIDSHIGMVARLGLDGVHLNDGPRHVRTARKELGADAIVGAFCGTSRHDGMSAGEAGADYVSFGPVRDTGLGDGIIAERDLFAWWSEMIEVPVVAEGGLDKAVTRELAPVTDFFGIGPEIWTSEDPATALQGLIEAAGPAR